MIPAQVLAQESESTSFFFFFESPQKQRGDATNSQIPKARCSCSPKKRTYEIFGGTRAAATDPSLVQLHGRFGARRTQYWLAFPGGGSSLRQSQGPRDDNKVTKRPNRMHFNMHRPKNNIHVKHFPFPKYSIHYMRPSRAGERGGRKNSLSAHSPARAARAAVPQRPLF